MAVVITVLHVVACFFLIVVVLLQTGKGADIGAVFGGSSQTIFGSSGAGNLLTRLTTWTAALFMFTSLFLTWSSTRHLSSSIVDTIPTEPPAISEPLAVPEEGASATQPAAPAGESGDADFVNGAAPAGGSGAATDGSDADAGGTAPKGGAAVEKKAEGKQAAAPAAPPASGQAAAPSAP